MEKRKKQAPPSYITLPTAYDKKQSDGLVAPSEDSVERLREFEEEKQL